MTIKLSLIDDDYVVRAKTDLRRKAKSDRLGTFLQEIEEEMVPGKKAYLEIVGLKKDPVTFEISKFDR